MGIKTNQVIAGIGASAGGLEAFTQLLAALPLDTGIGFVLIQHLDPVHASILPELLAKTTRLPVTEIRNNMRVLPDHVYVISPNKDITISNGMLKTIARSDKGMLHLPIDRFLVSLAESQQENAIGVILSGTASDGTAGIRAVKAKGGITFAQDKSAGYQGMPRSAIASGCVDLIMSPQEIAKELARISKHPYILKPKEADEEEVLPAEASELKQLLFLLRRKTGDDFSHYKTNTVGRRIKRRMLVHKLSKLGDYIKLLKEDADEAEHLHQDILINVTSFFREAETFAFLQDTIFPRLIKNRPAKGAIRIWVPGCATGEEAYSLAIALTEFLQRSSLNFPVQIFGTDLNREAIKIARKGVYTQSDLENLAPKRIAQWFDRTEGGFSIVKAIRDLCIFAPHNVFADPPFARLDMISCCNLLIYLDNYMQAKIMQTFHYALNNEGFLILGKAESTGAQSKIFTQFDKNFRIYVKKNMALKRESVSGMTLLRGTKIENKTGSSSDITLPQAFDPQQAADNILLTKFMPASVVVNNELEILQFRGPTGRFLEPAQGKASLNLIKMAKAGLGIELRSAISKVRKSGAVYKKEGITLEINTTRAPVAIEVWPLNTSGEESYYLVLFKEDNTVAAPEAGKLEQSKPDQVRLKAGDKDRRINVLEKSLAETQDDMRAVTEEQEAANEELQTANEEILSSNEELQSINEELETGKEELESTNEELNTVNEELQNRNEELTQARDYAEAIISAVRNPMLVLDHNLRVKTVNKSFCQVFKVSPEETEGSYVYDLGNGQWDIPQLRKLLEEILPKQNQLDGFEVDHNFETIGHKIMSLNARRILRGDNKGTLFLLIIEDITEHKMSEQRKDDFISVASHELKTPITTILGYAELLNHLLKRSSDEKARLYLARMSDQINRFTGLVNGLLDVSRMQAGKLQLQKEEFDLVELVANTVEDLQHSTQRHKLNFIKTRDRELIVADKYRIGQVLINLITNAIKYSPASDKINVFTDSTKNEAIVRVQDFGIGISPENREKIFERFFQVVNNNKGSDAGLGLGLYISEDIITRHGGKLWVESKQGKGSTFTFSLPAKEAK